MGFSDLIASIRKRHTRTEEISQEDAAQTKAAERKLSANERELIARYRKEKEEVVSKILTEKREQDKMKYWHTDTLSQPNLFNKPEGNSLLKWK